MSDMFSHIGESKRACNSESQLHSFNKCCDIKVVVKIQSTLMNRSFLSKTKGFPNVQDISNLGLKCYVYSDCVTQVLGSGDRILS